MSWKNSIIALAEPEKKGEFLDIFIIINLLSFKISCSAELSMKIFYNIGDQTTTGEQSTLGLHCSITFLWRQPHYNTIKIRALDKRE